MKKSEILSNGRISNNCQVFGVKRYTLNGGVSDGLKVVECFNGKLRFLLNESKALDIMQIFCDGENMSFVSKNGFTAREIAFENRFEGGALYTCGLDAVGGVEGKEVHGSFHITPAEVIRAECAEDGIYVEADIKSTALFGKNLVMRRKIFSAYNSSKIELRDELVNLGTKEEDYCLLYHINLGYPLLAEGGKIIADTEKVKGRNDRAEKFIKEWDTVFPPEDNAEEACYYLKPKDGTVYYFNPRSKRKFTLNFSDNLDNFVLWKSWASGDYALGLEPTTTLLDENFSYRKISAGKSEFYRVTLAIE